MDDPEKQAKTQESSSEPTDPAKATDPPEPTDPLDKPYDPDRPPGEDNPVPYTHTGRRVLREWGIPEEKDGGPLDPWRKIRGTTFKPGQSGNPGGAPKGGGPSVARAIKRFSRLKVGDMKFGKRSLEALGIPAEIADDLEMSDLIAAVSFFYAIKGSPQHLKAILERVDGKVPETINIETNSKAADIRAALAAMDEVDRGTDEDDAEDDG